MYMNDGNGIYAVDETEIGGEKFFLLEHEEHGDMAACVAVDEQSKLVAEDLWNGFDDEFLDVDKDRLVRFNGFFPKPQSGTYLILDEGGYQVAGQKGTWLVSDEVEVDGQRFVQMRSEQTKNPPPSIKRGGCEDYISAESLVERIHGLPVKSIEFITEEDQRKDA